MSETMVNAFDEGFRFTVMAGNKRVAVITAGDRFTLDLFVDGDSDEGTGFRQELIRRNLWHPSMPLTVLLADGMEATTFDLAGNESEDPNGEIDDAFVYWIDENDLVLAPPTVLSQELRGDACFHEHASQGRTLGCSRRALPLHAGPMDSLAL